MKQRRNGLRFGWCCLVAVFANVACSEDNGNPILLSAGGTTSATASGGATQTATTGVGGMAPVTLATGGNTSTSTGPALGGGTSTGGATAVVTGGTTSGGATGVGGATGPGGATGDPFVASVTPTPTGSKYAFTIGRNKFVVDASKGGRIVEFSIDGTNALHSEGSTVWPAPQTVWGWPPPPAIDSAAYTASVADNVLTLVGKTDSTTSDDHKVTSVSITKRFWANLSSGLVTCEYELINQGTAAASWAAWENTRVQRGGYTFFPEGGVVTGDTNPNNFSPLTLVKDATSGIDWLDFANAGVTADNHIVDKDGADGWLAHVNKLGTTGSFLFLRQFADTAAANLPAGHGEIRLWASGTDATKTYVEVENVGPKKSLAAKASLKRTIRWSLSEIPATVTVAAKSATLVDYVKTQLVAGASTEPAP